MKCTCPACKKSFIAKTELAGRKIKCPGCGAVLTLPPVKPPSKACPHCGAELAPDAMICVQCGFDSRTGQTAAAAATGEENDAPKKKKSATRVLQSSFDIAWRLRWAIVLVLLGGAVLGFRVYSKRAKDHRAFKAAYEKNSLASYQEYISNYPEGIHADEAETHCKDHKQFAASAKKGTIEAYEAYLEDYPNGRNADEAWYRITEKRYTVAAFEEYLRRFPQGRHCGDATEWIATFDALGPALTAKKQGRPVHEIIAAYQSCLLKKLPEKYANQARRDIGELVEKRAAAWGDEFCTRFRRRFAVRPTRFDLEILVYLSECDGRFYWAHVYDSFLWRRLPRRFRGLNAIYKKLAKSADVFLVIPDWTGKRLKRCQLFAYGQGRVPMKREKGLPRRIPTLSDDVWNHVARGHGVIVKALPPTPYAPLNNLNPSDPETKAFLRAYAGAILLSHPDFRVREASLEGAVEFVKKYPESPLVVLVCSGGPVTYTASMTKPKGSIPPY